MIFFTADQHFGHKNIIHLCDRPYKSVDEMDKALINNWNSVVQPNDAIYVIGDFAYKLPKRLSQYTSQLNGHKHIITGNHDRLPHIEYEQNFESVSQYMELEMDNRWIILFHYPILSWSKRARGAWHLYGHVHNAGQMKQLENMKAWNVGVDVNYYRPISYEELKPIMLGKGIQVKDV